ncbi:MULTISPECIES: hypothetical protein [Halolactibacillus]|uniref:hypothetical protein n=1 Tax=Halolactibacillus TaxID=306539 RepID=UPI0011604538|nr:MULTISPECIES: hypothetical protein [Halolactibacillus]
MDKLYLFGYPSYNKLLRECCILGNISSLEFFYVVFGISLLMELIYNVISEKNAIIFLLVYHVYEPDRAEYDFTKTLRNYKLFALTLIVYSAIIIVLTYIFGTIVSKVGMWIFFLIVIIGSKFLNPVKKT